jgi:hypothetical protein
MSIHKNESYSDDETDVKEAERNPKLTLSHLKEIKKHVDSLRKIIARNDENREQSEIDKLSYSYTAELAKRVNQLPQTSIRSFFSESNRSNQKVLPKNLDKKDVIDLETNSYNNSDEQIKFVGDVLANAIHPTSIIAGQGHVIGEFVESGNKTDLERKQEEPTV